MGKGISVAVLMKELALSQTQTYRLLERGMPRDSIEAALRWRREHWGYGCKLTRPELVEREAHAKEECAWWGRMLFKT